MSEWTQVPFVRPVESKNCRGANVYNEQRMEHGSFLGDSLLASTTRNSAGFGSQPVPKHQLPVETLRRSRNQCL